jgi:hypothetical protein
VCIVKVSLLVIVEDIVGFLDRLEPGRSFFAFRLGDLVGVVGQSRLLTY